MIADLQKDAGAAVAAALPGEGHGFVALDVTDDGGTALPVDDEAVAWSLQVYDWLGHVQSALLDCLPPRPPEGAG